MPLLVLVLGFSAFGQQADPEKLIEAGHWKRARAVVDARLRDAPADSLENFLLSQIRNAFGDRSSPQKFAEKAVELDGQVAKYHRQLAEVMGVEAQHAGPIQQLFLARRFRKEIDAALALDPRDIQAQRDLLEFYLLAPGIVGGDSRRAAATAERLGEIDAPEGFLAKARIASFHKHASEAEAQLRRAAQAQPPSYRARIALGQYFLAPEHSDPGEAESVAKDALLLDRYRVDAYAILAEIYAGRSDWAALDSTLVDGARQVPDDLTPDYRAADVLLHRRVDPARAERYLRAYLGQEPEGNQPRPSEAHWKLGRALEAQGRQTAAMAEWSESVRLDPDSPAATDLRRLGDTDSARLTAPAKHQ